MDQYLLGDLWVYEYESLVQRDNEEGLVEHGIDKQKGLLLLLLLLPLLLSLLLLLLLL